MRVVSCSVAPLALLASRYPAAAGELARFPEHTPDPQRSRWYTFPRMQDEVLCFTQYDRKLGRPSEIWHCALPEVVEAARKDDLQHSGATLVVAPVFCLKPVWKQACALPSH